MDADFLHVHDGRKQHIDVHEPRYVEDEAGADMK